MRAIRRTRRDKIEEMARRGTPPEQDFARRWIEAHPLGMLSADEILEADDSAYGPTGSELDAEVDRVYRAFARRPRHRTKGLSRRS